MRTHRNHLPVPPKSDPSLWRLEVGGEDAHQISLSLEDLKTKWVGCPGHRAL